jgi:hypothetical protein
VRIESPHPLQLLSKLFGELRCLPDQNQPDKFQPDILAPDQFDSFNFYLNAASVPCRATVEPASSELGLAFTLLFSGTPTGLGQTSNYLAGTDSTFARKPRNRVGVA